MITKYLTFFAKDKYDLKLFLPKLFSNYLFFFSVKNTKMKWGLKNISLFLLTCIFFISAGLGIFLIKINITIKITVILLLFIFNFIFLIPSIVLVNFIEKKIYAKQITLLKSQLALNNQLKIIGIAGNSGKSTINRILQNCIPQSLGIDENIFTDNISFIKKIKNELNNTYKFLLCSLDCYKKGQIKTFCSEIKPHIGILISINERNLELFKNIQNTIDANFELLQNLKEDGIAIVNLDNDLIYDNLEKIRGLRLIGVTAKDRHHKLCQSKVSILDITAGEGTTFFNLKISDKFISFSTKLAGKYNLYNLASAIACAYELNIDIEKLANQISVINGFEHMLEIKKYRNFTFIDDMACNNVDAFREGLKILYNFPGLKIIATTGLSGVGKKSRQVHLMLGEISSKICDWIILIGDNNFTDGVRQGALENKFAKDRIVRVKSYEEAYRFVHKTFSSEVAVLLSCSLSNATP